ncbi:MFS transporter, partial [Streptomyces sp. NPDC056004]
DALPQNGQGQAFGLLGSGNMTLQGVGPACFGAVAAGIGTGGAIALAGGAAALTAGWILTWHPPTRVPVGAAQ